MRSLHSSLLLRSGPHMSLHCRKEWYTGTRCSDHLILRASRAREWVESASSRSPLPPVGQRHCSCSIDRGARAAEINDNCGAPVAELAIALRGAASAKKIATGSHSLSQDPCDNTATPAIAIRLQSVGLFEGAAHPHPPVHSPPGGCRLSPNLMRSSFSSLARPGVCFRA